MATLFNEKTGGIESNVAESEVDDKILSGGYRYAGGPGDLLWVQDASGNPLKVEATRAADYIRAGTATHVSPLKIQQWHENQEFADSGLGAVAAAALGVDDYLLAGLPSSIGEATGLIDEGLTEAIQARNPWIYHGTGAPLAVAAALYSGGTSLMGRASLAAGRGLVGQASRQIAAEAAEHQAKGIVKRGFNQAGEILGKYTLPGISSKIGAKVAEGTTAGLFKAGNKYLPYKMGNSAIARSLGAGGSKVVGAMAGGFVEGGMWGAGEGISESVLGEPEDAAEHILNSVGTNALIGLMFGGAVSSAVPMLTGAKGMGYSVLNKIIDVGDSGGEKAFSKVRDHIVKVAAETHNLSQTQQGRLRDLLTLKDKAGDDYRTLKDVRDNIEGHANEILKYVDTQLLADDYIQMADMSGFSRKFLADEVVKSNYVSQGKDIPSNVLDIVRNVRDPLKGYRREVFEIGRKHPATDADGTITRLIIDADIAELKAYRSLFSESVEGVVKKGNAQRRTVLMKKRAAKDAADKKVDAFKTYWRRQREERNLNLLKDKLRKAHEERIKGGKGGFTDFDELELEHALKLAEDTGDIADLLRIVNEVRGKVKAKDILGPEVMEEWSKVKKLLKKDEVDLSEDAINHIDMAIPQLRKSIDSHIKILSKRRSADVVDPVDSGMLDYMDATLSPNGSTLRQNLDDASNRLQIGYHDKAHAGITADAYKSLEVLQTRLHREIYYGKRLSDQIPDIDYRIKSAIDNLQSEMKDQNNWGILAQHKERFNELANTLKDMKEKNLSKFTESIESPVATTGKLVSYLRKLDKNTADADTAKLKVYHERSLELMEFIRDSFDPAAMDGVPAVAKSKLNAKLARLKKIPLRDKRLGKIPTEDEFKGRMDDLIGFFSQNAEDLGKKIEFMREELPIANLLMGPQAAAANLNQSLREVGRGGIVGVGTYALTGSPTLSVMGGALAGLTGMAQNPKQLVNMMHQLRSIRNVSKNSVTEAFDSWSQNEIPRSAIHRGWEHQARQTFLIASSPLRRDPAGTQAERRKKAAKTRSIDAWQSRIQEALGSPLEADSFFEARASIEQLSASSMTMERFLDETTRVFAEAPDVRKAMKSLIRNHVEIAKRAIPKTSRSSMFNEEYPPTPVQLQKFAGVLQMLTDPVETLLTGMLTGTLTTQTVATLKEAWPKVYSDVYEKAMDTLSDKDKMKSLNQGQKQTLATLLGLPYANQNELSRMQQNYEGEEEKPGPSRGPRGEGITSFSQASSGGTMTAIVER